MDVSQGPFRLASGFIGRKYTQLACGLSVLACLDVPKTCFADVSSKLDKTPFAPHGVVSFTSNLAKAESNPSRSSNGSRLNSVFLLCETLCFKVNQYTLRTYASSY